jgi:hypothetical protein
MAMVIGNVYKPGNTLLFDHIHRRELTSEAIEEYHEKVLEYHENFTDSIAETMKASRVYTPLIRFLFLTLKVP